MAKKAKSKRSRPGSELERLVSYLERQLGQHQKVTVESPKFVRDKVTGELREHDVLVTFEASHHSSTVSIECRDRSRKVTVNDVEGFVAKCRDCGIDKVAMVSPRGFSKTAAAKAERCGVRMLRVVDVASFEWLVPRHFLLRTRNIRRTNVHFNIAELIDHPPKNTEILDPEGAPFDKHAMESLQMRVLMAHPDEHFLATSGTLREAVRIEGMVLHDKDSGRTFPIDHILLEIEYEISEEKIPFRFIEYEDAGTNTKLAKVAYMEIEKAIPGGVMWIAKPDGGSELVVVPDKAPDT